MLKNSQQVSHLGVTEDRRLIPNGKLKTAAAAKIRRNRHIKCCGYTAVVLLIPATIAVILASTVFRLRGPIVRIGNLTSGSLQLVPVSRGNMTLKANVRVRNPNFATIEYGNMTTTLFYRGAVVGESRTPPGRARARRTVTIGAAMEIMTDRILSQPDLGADILSGLVNFSSCTKVGGKIDLGVFEKRMTMKMSCNVSVNVTSKSIQQHKCKRKIKF